MSNIEFEHSFKVKDLQPFLDYCENNGFKKVSQVMQNRIVYENVYNNKVIARLTTQTVDGVSSSVLDFKNVSRKDGDLNVSSESIPLSVDDKNKEIVLSILNTLNFKIAANNVRTRYVYEKGNVKFEIDNYIQPVAKVIAIEGDEVLVEEIYYNIKDLIDKYKE